MACVIILKLEDLGFEDDAAFMRRVYGVRSVVVQ